MHADHPDTLVAARQECPLIVGIGEGETFVASAIPAFLAETRDVLGLKNGEIVTVTPEGARIVDVDGTPVEREVEEVTWDEEAAEKGGYPTFMLKEIHEQPDAVAETITDRLPGDDRVDLSELDLLARLRERPAAHRHRRLRHELPRRPGRAATRSSSGRAIPVEMDIASEYRYRDPVVGPDDLVIGITQSGRDGGHAGGHAARAGARREGDGADQHHGQPGDPRRRHRPLHARRPRDRRRGDEDLHRPGRRRCTCSGSGSRSPARRWPRRRSPR